MNHQWLDDDEEMYTCINVYEEKMCKCAAGKVLKMQMASLPTFCNSVQCNMNTQAPSIHSVYLKYVYSDHRPEYLILF